MQGSAKLFAGLNIKIPINLAHYRGTLITGSRFAIPFW